MTDADILSMANSGMTYSEIADRAGTTRSAIAGRVFRLRRDGESSPSTRMRKEARSAARSAELDRFAEAMAEHGGSCLEVSDAIGIPYYTGKRLWAEIRRRMGWGAW